MMHGGDEQMAKIKINIYLVANGKGKLPVWFNAAFSTPLYLPASINTMIEKLQWRRTLCVIGPFFNYKDFHKTFAPKISSVFHSVHEPGSMTFLTTLDAVGRSV